MGVPTALAFIHCAICVLTLSNFPRVGSGPAMSLATWKRLIRQQQAALPPLVGLPNVEIRQQQRPDDRRKCQRNQQDGYGSHADQFLA